MDLTHLKEIAITHGIDAVEEILIKMAFPALELAVKMSPTIIDDIVLRALEEPLKKAIIKLLEDLKLELK